MDWGLCFFIAYMIGNAILGIMCYCIYKIAKNSEILKCYFEASNPKNHEYEKLHRNRGADRVYKPANPADLYDVLCPTQAMPRVKE